MAKADKSTRVQKSRASKNSLYMTTFVLLFVLIFGLPIGSYIYMANTHKSTNSTPKAEEAQKLDKDKLPKPKEDLTEPSMPKETSKKTRSVSNTASKSSSNQLNNDAYDVPNSSSVDDNSNLNGTSTYTVQAGDNLYRIAVNHNMTQQELMNLNGLTEPVVSVGQVLKVYN